MNMQNLMAQAQKMQRDITKKKEEIDKTEFVGKSQWVEITLMGDKTLKKVQILNKNLASDDLDALEDMIKIAFDDAINKVDKEIENKMGMYSKMNGLM
jgi:nucleoid-associated protein EbfC